jgi:hypothetical protein
MPIEKIVPDATTTPHPTWIDVSGGTGNVNLALDADDSNMAACTTVTNAFIVSFGNLTSDIASINSIQFYVNGFDSGVRGGSDVVSFDLLNASDSSYSLSENKTFTDTTLATIQSGTERTTHDGSAAWTEALVNGLRMHILFATVNDASCVLDLDHLYINVDYNIPPTPTYDDTLNNITMNLGTTILSGGTIILD